jgi:hypothetical protein
MLVKSIRAEAFYERIVRYRLTKAIVIGELVITDVNIIIIICELVDL